MRIGIDIRAAQLGSSSNRGIGRYACDLVEGLTRFTPCAEYILLTLPNVPLRQRFLDLGKRVSVVQVPTQRLNFLDRLDERIRSNPAKLIPVWKVVCRWNQHANARAVRDVILRENLSLLHFTHGFEHTFFIGGKYACPIVLTCHDATPFVLHELQIDVWPLQLKYMHLQEAAYYKAVDRVVAVSKSAADDAVKYFGVARERVTVVYNAVADSFVRTDDRAVEGERVSVHYGISGPYYLFVGGGGPNKNRMRLTEAFAKVAAAVAPGQPKPQLVFAGPDGGDEASIRQLIHDAGLPDELVRVLGFIPDNDLIALFTNAVAILMPTLYEGFGLPAAEAMQIGTPVIGSNRGALPEVIGDGGLIVDPKSVDAIAGAMTRLLNEPDLRADLIVRGRKHVRQFTSERQAMAHFAMYRELIDARRQSGRRS